MLGKGTVSILSRCDHPPTDSLPSLPPDSPQEYVTRREFMGTEEEEEEEEIQMAGARDGRSLVQRKRRGSARTGFFACPVP